MIELVAGLLVVLLTSLIGWGSWVTLKLIALHHSIKYTNDNLCLIDWEKLPKRNLNTIFNKQKEK